MKANKIVKIIAIVMLIFFYALFKPSTHAIYRQTLGDSIDLNILDPNTNYTITLHAEGGQFQGGATTTTVSRTASDTVGTLTTPERTDYNFIGWYTSGGAKVKSSDPVTGNIDYYAHWAKIVCKKMGHFIQKNVSMMMEPDVIKQDFIIMIMILNMVRFLDQVVLLLVMHMTVM